MIKYIPYINIIILVILTHIYLTIISPFVSVIALSMSGFALCLAYNTWIITRQKIHVTRFINLVICNIELVLFIIAFALAIYGIMLGHRYF